ncbi:MAG: hypothetical protein ACYS7Y_04285 [Planctomycetota bacterium]|jgi:hypothetical protein
MTTAVQENQRHIAQTIIAQIKAADYWCLAACGARDYIALDENEDRRGGVMFRVTINPRLFHKVIVELTHMDEYKVTLWGGKRQALKGAVVEEVECFCDNLAEVVYTLCNN